MIARTDDAGSNDGFDYDDVSWAFAWKQRHLRRRSYSSLYAQPILVPQLFDTVQFKHTHSAGHAGLSPRFSSLLRSSIPYHHILIYSGINSGNIDFCQGNIPHCFPAPLLYGVRVCEGILPTRANMVVRTQDDVEARTWSNTRNRSWMEWKRFFVGQMNFQN